MTAVKIIDIFSDLFLRERQWSGSQPSMRDILQMWKKKIGKKNSARYKIAWCMK